MSEQVAAQSKYAIGRVYKIGSEKFKVCKLCGKPVIPYQNQNTPKICDSCLEYQGRLKKIQNKNQKAEAKRREKPGPGRPETFPSIAGYDLRDARLGVLGFKLMDIALRILHADVALGGQIARKCPLCGSGVRYAWDSIEQFVRVRCEKGVCGWNTSYSLEVELPCVEPLLDYESEEVETSRYWPLDLRPCSCDPRNYVTYWNDSVWCTNCGNKIVLPQTVFRCWTF